MAKRSVLLGVSYTWQSIAVLMKLFQAEVSLVNVADNEVLPTLLNPLRRGITQVSADGAYDTKERHKLLRRKGEKQTIPPRLNAGDWEDDHPQNEAVEASKSRTLKQWNDNNDHHQRSLSETAMDRYNQLISSKLSLRDYNAQVGEALAGVKAMNKVIELGMPIRKQAA